MTGEDGGPHMWEIRVEGRLSEVFEGAFAEMRCARLEPCALLILEPQQDIDAAGLALRLTELGQPFLSVRQYTEEERLQISRTVTGSSPTSGVALPATDTTDPG